MILTLPPHSNKCHSLTVYSGERYIEEHLIEREYFGDDIDIEGYAGLKDARFEHSPADERGNKEAPEYRAIARADGIWHAYDITAKNLGLPDLAPETKITDPHPVDGLESDGQDDAQPEVVEAAESLIPASDKKSRTRR